MTSTYRALLADWRRRTDEHATALVTATQTALNVQPAIADQLLLITPWTESTAEGHVYSQANVEQGPWVRVYSPQAAGGAAEYVWAKGARIIPDHAVAEVRYRTLGKEWDQAHDMAIDWPAKPCRGSHTTFGETDLGGADLAAGSYWCGECEHMAPVAQNRDAWTITAHDEKGRELPEPATTTPELPESHTRHGDFR